MVLIISLYMLLLLAGSLIPMDREIEGLNLIIDLNPGLQNFLHIPAFALLAMLWHRLFDQYRIDRRKGMPLLLLITIGFGIINEWVQYYIPGRYLSVTDVVLNTVGVVCGVWLYSALVPESSNTFHEPNRILQRRE